MAVSTPALGDKIGAPPATRGKKGAADFLAGFVAGVPLDPVWAGVLRDAGLTEEKLRQTAGAPEARLIQFIAGSSVFKNMIDIDQFNLASAIGRLAIPIS